MKRNYTDEDQYHDSDVYREYAPTREQIIEDKVYWVEKNFSTDFLVECIREADEADLQALNQALKDADADECWALLSDIKGRWVQHHAEFLADER